MKKPRKSRVEFVGHTVMQGYLNEYYLMIPYNKKNQVIPSSVECAYSANYFDLDHAALMLRAL